MGLEAYLFEVQLEQQIEERLLDELLLEVGFSRVNELEKNISSYRDYFYEINTILGVTEAHVLGIPNKTLVKSFSLRFSVMSPPTVIDQTFTHLLALNELVRLRLFDTEITNHWYNELRSQGEIGAHYQGIDKKKEEDIKRMSYILLDVDEFKQNTYEIMKRKLVLENSPEKEAIRNDETFDKIHQNGLTHKYFGWILKKFKWNN